MDVSFDFTGRVAIVTGAARGVGRSLVAAFATSGARVLATDRDADGLAVTCQAHDSAQVHGITADIRTPDGAADIVNAAVTIFGTLDFCVNNAAVAPHAGLLEERAEVWDTVFAVNCRGTFLMTQAAARAMISASRGGRIVNFSSGVATRGSAGAAAYASSRAATEAFSRVAAIELAPHSILVNCVSPGLIDTQPKPLPPSMAREPEPPHPATAPRPPRRAVRGRPAGPLALLVRRQLHHRQRSPRGRRREHRQPRHPRPGRRRGRPLRLGHRPHPLNAASHRRAHPLAGRQSAHILERAHNLRITHCRQRAPQPRPSPGHGSHARPPRNPGKPSGGARGVRDAPDLAAHPPPETVSIPS